MLKRQGGIRNGSILVPGATVEIPTDLADRLIADGIAEPIKAEKKKGK
jgi:hypothetical protein